MFSKSCEYGVRALIYIASESKTGQKLSIHEIAKAIEAPEYFTAKILQTLSRNRIVSSQKGIHGGFYLDKIQGRVKLIDAVTAIDGNILFTGCGLGLKQCSEKEPCPIHNKFKGIRNSLKTMLESTTIEDLGTSLRTGRTVLKSIEVRP